jgi:hypothetical protein
MGHIKGRLHTVEIGQEKETKNLSVFDVLTVLQINIVILNWAWPLWNGD